MSPGHHSVVRRQAGDPRLAAMAIANRALAGQLETERSALVGDLRDKDPLVRAEAARNLRRLDNTMAELRVGPVAKPAVTLTTLFL